MRDGPDMRRSRPILSRDALTESSAVLCAESMWSPSTLPRENPERVPDSQSGIFSSPFPLVHRASDPPGPSCERWHTGTGSREQLEVAQVPSARASNAHRMLSVQKVSQSDSGSFLYRWAYQIA